METYRFVWGVVATGVLGPAVVLAVGTGAGVEMVVLGAGLAVFVGMFAWVVAEGQPERWQWVRRSVLWAAIGATGAAALSTAWGTTGAVLTVLLVSTAPAVLVPARALYVASTSRRSTGPPESLSQRDLRRRWDATTGEVRHSATTVSRRAALVEERRRVLDELERRDPVHFDAWVVSAVSHDGLSRPRHRGR